MFSHIWLCRLFISMPGHDVRWHRKCLSETDTQKRVIILWKNNNIHFPFDFCQISSWSIGITNKAALLYTCFAFILSPTPSLLLRLCEFLDFVAKPKYNENRSQGNNAKKIKLSAEENFVLLYFLSLSSLARNSYCKSFISKCFSCSSLMRVHCTHIRNFCHCSVFAIALLQLALCCSSKCAYTLHENSFKLKFKHTVFRSDFYLHSRILLIYIYVWRACDATT